MKKITDKLKERFHRNIILPEIGEQGQEKLLNSSVLVVGCGGLGSASLFYLASAGIGKLGLIDSDKVELSNLQRQILHNEDRIGMKKVESAEITLKALFPEIQVEKFPERLILTNARKIFQKFDIIVDATDNLYSRYLMNYAALKEMKPIVMGGVHGFSGQVTTILPGETACYNCLFPGKQPNSTSNKRQETGVMGMMPGIIGSIQALEAVKVLLDIEGILANRLLIFEGIEMSFDDIIYKKNPHCPVCGEEPYDDNIPYD